MKLIAENVGYLLAIITLVFMLWKINKSPCQNHIMSFDKSYTRIEALEKQHTDTLVEIKEMKTDFRNTNKLLEELRDQLKEIVKIIYKQVRN